MELKAFNRVIKMVAEKMKAIRGGDYLFLEDNATYKIKVYLTICVRISDLPCDNKLISTRGIRGIIVCEHASMLRLSDSKGGVIDLKTIVSMIKIKS